MNQIKLTALTVAILATLVPATSAAQDSQSFSRCVKKTELANAAPTAKLLIRQKAEGTLDVTVDAKDPDHDTLSYSFSSTGGRIREGVMPQIATWDLAGMQPGTYTVTVEVDDGRGCLTVVSATGTVG